MLFSIIIHIELLIFLKIKQFMNIKEFIDKYKIIIFLVAMIIVLAFVKNYFGKKINENESNNTNTITPTIVSSKINNSTQEITKTPNNPIVSDNSNILIKEDNSQTNSLLINTEETDTRYKELKEKSRTYQTEEEYSVWFETLSFEDQQLLEGYNVVQISQLTDELPYEGSTFVVKSIFSNNLLIAKSKIDDLEKAESDLRDWLSTKAMDFEDLSISWIE